MTFKISIVGSSFIRRLNEAVTGGHDEAFKQNFNLDAVDSVNYVCRGGWKVQSVLEHMDSINRQTPDVVILQIGSNDLGKDRCPLSIADSILDLAETIRSQTSARFVVVCQCLPREKGRYLRTDGQVRRYNDDAKKANDFLKVVSADRSGVCYWKHKGLSRGPDQPAMRRAFGHFICSDGVHLSSRGQYKYYKSLRGAIKHAVNILQGQRSR